MNKRAILLLFILFKCCISEHYTFNFPWVFQDLDSKICLEIEFPYYDQREQVFQDLFSYIGSMVHLEEMIMYRSCLLYTSNIKTLET